MRPPFLPPPGAIVEVPELRRYLRFASTLLAAVENHAAERAQILRRARHWIGLVQQGLDMLVHDAERPGVPDAAEDPLTPRTEMRRIEPACSNAPDAKKVEP